jgi:pimeloyl-ACP methyl ester carboxylesterase
VTISIAGVDLELFERGQGDAILYLHGGGGIASDTGFLDLLARERRVIAPSHPGFGKSSLPDWLDSVDDIAHIYLELMDRLNLARADLVGFSLGGWIAAELAVRNTRRLNSLTLVGAAGIYVPGVPQVDTFLVTDEQLVRSLFHDQKRAEGVLAEMRRPELEDTVLKNRTTTAKLVWQPRGYDPHLHKWLHRIGIPTLLVWGANDKVLPPAYAHAYQRLIPGSKVVIIPECGHVPQAEQPQAFIAALEGFLDSKRAAA